MEMIDATVNAEIPRGKRKCSVHARAAGLLAGAFALLLSACGGSGAGRPQWIEAPLVADGQFDPVNADATYQGFGAELNVAPASAAVMRFSLASLPRASSLTAGGASPYQLSAERVLSARLVVYVDEVDTAGYVALAALQDQDGTGDCYAERAAPRCGVIAGPIDGTDPDTSVPWQVAYQGFNSFDVTALVKAAMSGSVPDFVTLQVSGTPANSAPSASFTIASKDKHTGQNRLERSAYLLITLDNAFGMSGRLVASNGVDASSPDANNPTGASLPLGNQAGQQKVALFDAGAAGQIAQFNPSIMQAATVVRIDGPLASSATAPGGSPSVYLGWLTGTAAQADQSQATWNSVQSALPASSASASGVLDADPATSNQIAVLDVTNYINPPTPISVQTPAMWMALSSNVTTPIDADAGQATAAPHPPRAVFGMSPLVSNFGDPDASDRNGPYQFDVAGQYVGTTWNQIYSQSVKAHVGLPFPGFILRVYNANSEIVYVPLNLRAAANANGAGATFPVLDFDSEDYSFSYVPVGVGGAQSGVGAVVTATANEIAGQHFLIATLAGHNVAPLTLTYQNLALPTAVLSGPDTVVMPPLAGQVTVAANAALPFTLTVDDSGNTDVLDDTDIWIVTSSDPTDTMPGNISRAEGSATFALTFGSLGARTITVTSKGAPQNTATLAVTVVKIGPLLTTSTGAATFHSAGTSASFAVAVDPQIQVTQDQGTTLASAAVTIGANFVAAEDRLVFANDGVSMGNIDASYDTSSGVLSMSSAGASASLAQWQAALRAVAYTNLAVTPHTPARTIGFRVIDPAGDPSNTATRNVNVARTSGSWVVLGAAEPDALGATASCAPAANFEGGTCASLREAINYAIDGDAIYFAADLDGATINLVMATNCLSGSQGNSSTCLAPAAGWPASGANAGQSTQFGASAFFISAKTITIDATQTPDAGGVFRPMQLGVTIARSTASGTAKFRFFDIDGTAGSGLNLIGVALQNGVAQGGNSNEAGAALGAGGAIFNRGLLNLQRVTFSANVAQGGSEQSSGNSVGAGGAGVGQNQGDAPCCQNGAGPNGAAFGDTGGFGGGGGGGGSGSRGGTGGFGGGGGSGGYGGQGGFGGGGGNLDNYGGGGGFGGGNSGGTAYQDSHGGGGAGMGGAVFNDAGTVRIVNSTFSANAAQGGATGGGAFGGSGFGGALFNYNGTMSLSFVTLATNTVSGGLNGSNSGSADGGAVYSLGDSLAACSAGGNVSCASSGASIVLVNSIASKSANGSGAAVNDVVTNLINGGASTIAGSGNVVMAHSLVAGSDAAGAFADGIVGSVDPKLAALAVSYSAANGFGLTAVPQSGSSAIDAAPTCNAADGSSVTIDQRGFVRSATPRCDIGAVETNGGYFLSVTVVGAGSVSAATTPLPVTGSIVQCTDIGGANCRAGYAPLAGVMLTAQPAPGQHFAGWSGDCASTDASLPLVIDAAKQCTATFASNQTATVLTSSGNPGIYGTSVTLTATVEPVPPASAAATGSVTFLLGGAPLAACSNRPLSTTAPFNATCVINGIAAGVYSITAQYSGDGNYPVVAQASSNSLDQQIAQAQSKTTLTTSNAVIELGESVTFAATAASVAGSPAPSGVIGFTDNGTPIAGCASLTISAGSATCTTSTLATGTHTIRADFGGDDNNLPSSDVQMQTVNAATTAMTLSASPNPAAYQQSVTLTAAVSVQSGSSAFAAVQASSVRSPSRAATSANAIAAITPVGTVSFYDGVTALGSASLDVSGIAAFDAGVLTPGAHTLSATYAGSDDFVQARAQITLMVNEKPVPAPVLSWRMLSLLALALAGVAKRRLRLRRATVR